MICLLANRWESKPLTSVTYSFLGEGLNQSAKHTWAGTYTHREAYLDVTEKLDVLDTLPTT
jgi:hypothetical protein